MTKTCTNLHAGHPVRPATLLLLLLLCPHLLLPLGAQLTSTPPIKLKSRDSEPKVESFRGEVLHFGPVAITLRDPKDMTRVRTFTYSPELAQKLEGRYMEYGQRVTVKYLLGTDTAVKLKGRIRKQPENVP